MPIRIRDIEYYLPDDVVTNDDLQHQHPDWDIQRVGEKAGVKKRRIARPGETSLNLAERACDILFSGNKALKEEVGGIVFCTQTPDYIMPSNAFLLHKYLNLKSSVLAFDYNLACSGYVYGLAIVRGLIETKVADHILLVTAETYSKLINENDRSTKVLFGDGAAVSVISASSDSSDIIDVLLESSGNEYDTFYIPAGACRMPSSPSTKVESKDSTGNVRSPENIYMNGFAVWKFISRTVPEQIEFLLKRNHLKIGDVKLFLFHQASKLTLDSLSKALGLREDQMFLNLQEIGNTVSASIPIAMKDARDKGLLERGDLIVISGFGVGLSWGSILMRF